MGDCQNQIRLDVLDPNKIILDSPNEIALNCGSKIPGGFKATPGAPSIGGGDAGKSAVGHGGPSGVRGSDAGKEVKGNAGSTR